MIKKVAVSVYLTPKEYKALKKHSDKTDRAMSSIIKELLRTVLSENKNNENK